MRKWILGAVLALVAIGGGLVYATSRTPAPEKPGYVCPITGETLPCPNCCPLNNR